LHAEVPQSRWCVSYTDFEDFGHFVHHAAKQGVITPTSQADEFDPSDPYTGPRMDLVSEQFVKPVTSRAGGMSWALMMHPEGLPCDLFITHCWQEGVYELISKVLHSWPRGAQGAYCCVLSNPQCLDIGSLLDDPSKSPFAMALRASTWLLVVPNRATSPYARIWCVYEAFLAYSWNKAIYTASAPIRRHWAHPLGVSLTAAVGASLALLARRLVGPVAEEPCVYWVFMLAVVLSYANILAPPLDFSVALCYTYASSALCGISAGINLPMAVAGRAPSSQLAELAPPAAWMVYSLFAATSLAACASDLVRDRQLHLETAQLRNKFTGSLDDAMSSEPSDRERIMAEIQTSGSWEQVNRAVEVLLLAGVSTPSLRAATERGGDVRGAARWSLGHVLAVALVWVAAPVTHVLLDESCGQPWRFVPCLKVLQGLAWLLLFVTKQPDQRSFVTRAACKLAVVPYLLVWLLWVGAAFVIGSPLHRRHCVPDAVSTFLLGPCMLALAAAGVAGTASVPMIGPRVVTFALTLGRREAFPAAAPAASVLRQGLSDCALSRFTELHSLES